MARSRTFDWKADLVRPGRRTRISPLHRDDLRAMAAWPRNNDVREAPFNDFARDAGSMDAYYRSNVGNPHKQGWTVRDERGEIIGRYTIVLVDPERREGLISVRFRADRTGLGYGQDSLPSLLEHWFDTLNMAVMALDVSVLNERAIHLYEKYGFRLIGYHWVPIHREHIVPGVSDSGYVRYLDMQLDREDWQRRK